MSALQFTTAGLALIFTAAIPRSWQQFSLFLIRSGLFADECPGMAVDNTAYESLCLAQEKRIGDLLSIYMAAWSSGGALAGPFMDHFGPRLTCLVGEVVQIGSMALMVFSNMNGAAVTAALIAQGLFCNFIYYTTMMLSDYHPQKASLITGFATACVMFGSAVPPIILLIWSHYPEWSFRWVFGLYTMVFMIPCATLLVATTPNIRGGDWIPKCDQREHSLVEIAAAEPIEVLDKDKDDTASRFNSHSGFLTAPPSRSGMSFQVIPPGSRNFPSSSRHYSGSRYLEGYPSKNESIVSYLVQPSKEMSVLASVGGSLAERPRVPDQPQLSLLQALRQKSYLLILILAALPCLAHVWYPAVLRDMSGENISLFVGWGIMSQGIWCIIWGWVGDAFMSTDMMTMTSIFTLMTFVCLLIPNNSVQYVTGSIWIIGNSYVFSPRYTACRVFCPPQHLGTLMGIAGILLGIVELCNLPLARLSAYRIVAGCLMSLTVVLFVPIFFLRRMERALKTQTPQWYTSRTFSDLGSFAAYSPKVAPIVIQRANPGSIGPDSAQNSFAPPAGSPKTTSPDSPRINVVTELGETMPEINDHSNPETLAPQLQVPSP